MKKLFIIIILFIILITIKFIELYYQIEPFYHDEKTNKGFLKLYENFLTPEDCNSLIAIAKDKFTDSTIYLDSNENTKIDKNIRSSSNYYFKRRQNPIISKIEHKISNLLNIPITHIEPIQLVRYENSQQYTEHYDFLYDKTNERTHSFIIYLNTLSELDGGATNFILYREKIYPIQGNAICFKNMNPDKSIYLMSLHAGEKILTDKIKYILTVWIREKEI